MEPLDKLYDGCEFKFTHIKNKKNKVSTFKEFVYCKWKDHSDGCRKCPGQITIYEDDGEYCVTNTDNYKTSYLIEIIKFHLPEGLFEI